jgi:hypothetical protein
MMTLGELVTNCQGLIADTSATVRTQVVNAINRHYNQLCVEVDLPDLWTEGTATASGTDLIIPSHVSEVVELIDVANSRRLTPDNGIIEQAGSSALTAGTSYMWGYNGLSPVVIQPTASQSIKVVASTATTITATVVGLAVAGATGAGATIPLKQTGALVGATEVALTTSLSKILSFSLETISAYRLRLYYVTDLVTAAEIMPGATVSEYLKLRLWYQPATGATFWFKGKVKPIPLSANGDAPLFDCGNFLIHAAAADIFRRERQLDKAQYEQGEAERIKGGFLAGQTRRARGARRTQPALRRFYD